MKTEELAEIAKKAKELGIAISGWSERDFDGVRINENGSISVHFSRHYSGYDTDYDIIDLEEEDMVLPFEKTIIKYQKIAQDKAESDMKAKLEKEISDNIAKEKRERDTYEKLRMKFENQNDKL